jgi:hypothetical protein
MTDVAIRAIVAANGNGRAVARIIERDCESCTGVIRQAHLIRGRGRSVDPSITFPAFPRRPEAPIKALPTYLAPGFRAGCSPESSRSI